MASSLGDARERLARIEGILRIGLPTTTAPESNAEPAKPPEPRQTPLDKE